MDQERGIEGANGIKDTNGAEDVCDMKDANSAEDANGRKDLDGAKDARGIEEVFSELEEILSRMQDPQVTLQDSFALYEKGVRDIRLCDEMLDRIEKRMLALNPDGSVRPFEEEEQDGIC